MNKRIEYIDFLRGIAIIIVVMGHLLQYNLKGNAATGCFNYIYSFHMGFFFFISGCAASFSIRKNTWNTFLSFIKKKTVQLLVPFFIWGAVITLSVSQIDILAIPERVLQILSNPSLNAPWFLFQLFFIQVIFFICCTLNSIVGNKIPLYLTFFISIPIVVILQWLSNRFLGVGGAWLSRTYLILFYLGVVAQSVEIKAGLIRPIVFICFLVFVLIAPLYNILSDNDVLKEIIKTISSITFSFVCYYIVKYKYQKTSPKVKNLINYYGTNTLEIYVTQFCIVTVCQSQWIETGTMNSVPLFLIVLIVSIPITYVVLKISEILKMIPYMSLLLYGKNDNFETVVKSDKGNRLQ